MSSAGDALWTSRGDRTEQTGRRELPGAARGRHTSRRGDTSARPSRFREPKLAAKISNYNLSHYAPFSLRGAPTSRMGMTTVWRPRVRIDVPDVGDAEKTDTSREGLTTRGTKRKIAPMHRGPCEHGVKHRSNCKVCIACPHGRRRSLCKECGGSGICEHGRQRHQCKECGGSQICEHGRERSRCKECGGASICEHGRVRSRCIECGGASICEHVVGALSARSAMGHQSASMVVGALSARSAVGLQSASTVVGALYARSAVGQESASTVVCALGARSAVGRESASTVGGAIDARIVLD